MFGLRKDLGTAGLPPLEPHPMGRIVAMLANGQEFVDAAALVEMIRVVVREELDRR